MLMCKECNKAYRRKHTSNPKVKARISEYNRQHRLSNIDKRRSYEKSYQALHLENCPIHRLIKNNRQRLSSLLRAADTSKNETTLSLIGCTKSFLRTYLESLFRDGMSWDNYGSLWHCDHIKPVSSFDHTNLSDRKTCWHYTNLQPLLAEENLRKSNKCSTEIT